jgi:hypothetical protein
MFFLSVWKNYKIPKKWYGVMSLHSWEEMHDSRVSFQQEYKLI